MFKLGKKESRGSSEDIFVTENYVDEQKSSSIDEAQAPRQNTIHRKLKPRHVQLIAMGGAIGTVLFVQLGNTMIHAGPASIFIAFSFWCLPVICATNVIAEMVTKYPLAAPFIKTTGRCCDEALEVSQGWNFFILQATLVPFEITGVTLVLHYWRSDFNPAYAIVPQLVLMFIINILVPVQYFGEVEFWLAIFKVLMIVGLIFFTFITMVGGNPHHDVYGFRNWNKPAPFLEYFTATNYTYEGDLGRFIGFAAAISMACYTVSGPDYLSLAAGEAYNPRKTLPATYKSTVFRLCFFFMLGSLSMGIVCSARDPSLMAAWASGSTSGAASPYVVAMNNLNIPVLPHIVNGGILLSAFSAGNSYFFTSSRTLYSLASEGKAPKCFTWCTKNGIPWASCLVIACFALLSLLQLSQSANTVLTWIVSIGTSSLTINYVYVNFTYLRFYYGMKKQGLDRKDLPYCGPFQPFCAYFALVCMFCVTWLAGFEVFLKGNWEISTFIFKYVMIPFNILCYSVWKLIKRTKFKKLEEIDFHSGLEEVTEHEKHVVYKPPRNKFDKFLRALIGDA